MNKITLNLKLNKKGILMASLILCCLFTSKNVFSQNEWMTDYIKVYYDNELSRITTSFIFLDHNFKKESKIIYLKSCDFFWSDGKTERLIVESKFNFPSMGWSEIPSITMEKHNTKFNFGFRFDSSIYGSGEWWQFNIWTQIVKVYLRDNKATNIMGFYPGDSFAQQIKTVIVRGEWNIAGNEEKFELNFPISVPPAQKMTARVKANSPENHVTTQGKPEQKGMDVYTQAGEIIIKGANLGENITIYSTSGKLIKSIVTNTDVVKTKVASNQVYIVNIGKSAYKVAL